MKTLTRLLIAICVWSSTHPIAAQQPSQGDKYYAKQWHLTGQVRDEDTMTTLTTAHINVESVWDKYRGEGTYIAIVEGDIEQDHPDLKENFSNKYSVDFFPYHHIPVDAHGTRVAGVAAARGYNGKGVRGVAPLAKIVSLNPGGGGVTVPQQRNRYGGFSKTTRITLESLTLNREVIAAHNYSVEYGVFERQSEMELMAIETSLTEGFHGKGMIYVRPAGNDNCDDEFCGENNANYDVRNSHHATVTAGGVDYLGKHVRSSDLGSNLWNCAPSGGKYLIVTTDLTRLAPSPGFSTAGYTRTGGTSFAAPIVAGVIALMRQANPNLSWRDVKLILAASAQKNDPTDRGWLNGRVQYGSFNERYHFNHKYGFGLVDAQAAVDLAEDWVNVPERAEDTVMKESHQVSAPRNRDIRRSMDIQSDIDFIEYVDATIDFEVDNWRNLGINLTSPSGKVSKKVSKLAILADRPYMLPRHPSDIYRTGRVENYRFGTAVHLGESAWGTWELEAKTQGYGDTLTLYSWELRIRGFKVEMDAVADGDLSDLNTSATLLTLSLSGAHWKEGLQPSNFSLKNAPSGLSIAEVQPTSDTQVVQLKLDFDGTLDDKYDFQVQATTGTVTNLTRALVSNDIEIARVALKTTTIPQSTVGTQYHYTMENAFASPTSLTYIIKLVDEEGNVLDTQIPGLTIDGHTIRGIPETVGTHRLRVEAIRNIDDASRTEYFVFSVEPHTIELHLRVLLEGLQPPNP